MNEGLEKHFNLFIEKVNEFVSGDITEKEFKG